MKGRGYEKDCFILAGDDAMPRADGTGALWRNHQERKA